MKEFNKRTGHGVRKPGDDACRQVFLLLHPDGFFQFFFQFPGVLINYMHRFTDNQCGGDANTHECGHNEIGRWPGPGLGDIKGAGTGYQQGDPVTEYIGRCHGALHVLFHGFNAIGIDADVLGRGAKGDQQGKNGQPGQFNMRVGQCHTGQAEHDGDLCGQHPATSFPQPRGQSGEWQPVDHRCPEELDGVGDAYPAEEADGRAGDANVP